MTDAGRPLALRSLRKVEKAEEDSSSLVRSVRREFSALSDSHSALRLSASVALTATSPSSWPIYSANH